MKYKINLLAVKETSFIDKVMYFSLNYLRYIIVVTQLVVICVFFYRFQIDQRIIDLKESVDQKKEIVEIVLPLLQEASKIDKKSKEIAVVLTKQKNFNNMFEYLTSIFPETITLTDLESKEDSLKITGIATNPKHLQTFMNLLKSDAKFKKIDLNSIKRVDAGYNFIILLDKFKTG